MNPAIIMITQAYADGKIGIDEFDDAYKVATKWLDISVYMRAYMMDKNAFNLRKFGEVLMAMDDYLGPCRTIVPNEQLYAYIDYFFHEKELIINKGIPATSSNKTAKSTPACHIGLRIEALRMIDAETKAALK